MATNLGGVKARQGRRISNCPTTWLAEEDRREPGAQLDEKAVWEVWDDCSERELRTLRAEAGVALRKWRLRVALQIIGEWFHSGGWVGAAFRWTGRTLFEGFVGGIGLIVLGLLFVLLAPHAAKSIRSALDDALPTVTQPDERTPPACTPSRRDASGKPC
jgi:hypothetical protein